METIINLLTLAGMVFIVYKYFRDPDVKAGVEIALLKMQFKTLNDNCKLLKENHIAHIEKDIRGLREQQVKIFTILEERLPNRGSDRH